MERSSSGYAPAAPNPSIGSQTHSSIRSLSSCEVGFVREQSVGYTLLACGGVGALGRAAQEADGNLEADYPLTGADWHGIMLACNQSGGGECEVTAAPVCQYQRTGRAITE